VCFNCHAAGPIAFSGKDHDALTENEQYEDIAAIRETAIAAWNRRDILAEIRALCDVGLVERNEQLEAENSILKEERDTAISLNSEAVTRNCGLRMRITDLEAEIADKDAEIAKLKADNARLKKNNSDMMLEKIYRRSTAA
jgi:cell division protein FtsB